MVDSDSDADSWGDPIDANDDDDDDSAADPFTFQKHAFRKKREGLDQESPPKNHGRRKTHNVSVSDKALEELERRQEKASLKRHLDRAANDDDSDLEVLEEGKQKPDEKKAKTDDVLELSSDDEDGVTSGQYARHRAPMDSKLMEAKRARSQLSAAQHYHAEDVYVPEPVMDLASPDAGLSAAGPARSAAAAAPTNLGPALRLSLRTSQLVQGTRTVVSTDAMSIRQREPFQNLLERYRTEKGIASNTRVTFSFDGQRVHPDSTPAAYDMEDEDLVESIVEGSLGVVSAASAAPVASNRTRNLGAALALVLRTKEVGKNVAVTKDVLRIRAQEPLQILLDKYKKEKNLGDSARVRFEFDGEAINLQKTPQSYDMEDEDIIDVSVSR